MLLVVGSCHLEVLENLQIVRSLCFAVIRNYSFDPVQNLLIAANFVVRLFGFVCYNL